MKKEDLIKYKEKLSKLSKEEQELRDLYLKNLASGKIQGPMVGYPSIDKPGLQYYSDDAILEDMPEVSAYEYIYNKNKERPDNIALTYFNRKVTYKELFERIDECAKSLIKLGVKEGDIISISLPNTPESAYLFYAISKIGAVANMIDPRTSADGIVDYINEVHSKYLFMIDVANVKILDVKDKTEVTTVINVSPADSFKQPLHFAYNLKQKLESKDKDYQTPSDFIPWKKFVELGKDVTLNSISVDNASEKPVLIVHTGGTTGPSKGVVLSNKNINAIPFQSMQFPTPLEDYHKWLDIMPPFIAYGIGTGLHFPLSAGMNVILIPQFNPDEFDKLIWKYKPNHMSGVPSHWNNIINSKLLKNKDLSFLINCCVGGDTMNYDLEKKSNEFLKNHGCKYEITKGYGMTEVNGSIGRTTTDTNTIGTVGVPFTKSNIKICDPNTGEELTYGKEGEIYITGPSMMIEYYNNIEETNKVKVTDACGTKWIKSGDIGYMNSDGNMFIVDRIKRIIIRNDGFKVFPSVIEKAIESHKLVKSCRVVGMKDVNSVQGQLPCAFIVLKEEAALYNGNIEQEISDICRDTLPEYMLPSRIEFKDELPLTPIGKVDTLSLTKEIDSIVLDELNQKTLKK